MNRQIRRVWEIFRFDRSCRIEERKRIGKDRWGRQAATGIRYGNFQFGQNLRIYPYAARDMYYAGGTVSWPSVRRGLREDGAIGVAEEGRRTGEGRGSMCVTCVAAITQSRGWLPGNAFQPPHTHTTLDQPQNPLLSLPYFTSWRTISFFWLSNTTGMPHCSTTSNADFNSRHCDRPHTFSLSFSSFWWSFSQRFYFLLFFFSFFSFLIPDVLDDSICFSSLFCSLFRKVIFQSLLPCRKKIFHYFSFFFSSFVLFRWSLNHSFLLLFVRFLFLGWWRFDRFFFSEFFRFFENSLIR